MTTVKQTKQDLDDLIAKITREIFDLNQSAKQGEDAAVKSARVKARSALQAQRAQLRQLRRDLEAQGLNALAARANGWTIDLEKNQVEKTLKGFATVLKAAAKVVAKFLREMEPAPAAAGVAPQDPAPPVLTDAPLAEDPPVLRAGLAAPSADEAMVFGHVVRQVQERLEDAGYDPGGVDMRYGGETAKAAEAWQRDVGASDTGSLTLAELALLKVDPAPDLFDLCAQVTAGFEGHGFTRSKGDFDGAVFTWGYHGYTLKYGHVQAVLERVEALDRTALGAAFGARDARTLRRILGKPLKDQIAWGRKTLIQGAAADSDWAAGFRRLGETAAGRAAQLAHSREAFWERIALPQADKLGLTEPLSRAQLFDTAIQQGGLSDEALARIEAAFAAAPALQENAKRRIVAREAANSLASGRYRDDVLARRLTFVDGLGTVHGKRYELSDWGLAASADEVEAHLDEHTPAAPRPALAPAPNDFQTWFDQNVKPQAPNFDAEEFLVMGAGNSGGGACHGKNALPPQALWENMIPLAIALQAFRRTMGAPVRLTSAYRSPAYNSCIGGAAQSQHKAFRAADIVCAAGDPAKWRGLLGDLRNQGVFTGGIGLYRSFVHVDVRGWNADWRG